MCDRYWSCKERHHHRRGRVIQQWGHSFGLNMSAKITGFFVLLLVFAFDCGAAGIPLLQAVGTGKHDSTTKDNNVHQGKRSSNPMMKPISLSSLARIAKIAKVNTTNNSKKNMTKQYNVKIQDRRPQHLGPMSPLKFNITNRLAARRYDKNFNFTRHDLHLLFNSYNNGTNTSVVSVVGRGKSGKPGSVVLQNRTKEVINGHGKINPIANVLMKNMTSNENNGSNVNNDISSVGKKKPSPKVAAIMKASSKAAAALSNTNVSNVLGVNNKNNTKKGKPIPDTDDNVFNVEYPIPESLLKLENESVKEFTKIDGWIRNDITNDNTIMIAIYCILPLIILYGLCCIANSLFALCCICCVKADKVKKQPYLPLATDEDELMVDGEIEADFEDFMRNGEDVGRQLEMGTVNSRYDRRRYPYSPSSPRNFVNANDDSVLGPDEDTASF